ncbi:type 2 periplasmic-binding domain-containing protein [Roseibium alexandrii]|uniref:Solute-binding protein family 3/N-terminal domain-containing protein n=1 Tax=Roseibium alexandrii (strain DSM 17067 / NCIMB 14079 / DFL-11) TaxID=244592 RepID=A0A5E8GY25_ROSAD|nr:hypothetical protein [Roseibium alexandrii]EEE44915.2 hypothetical protein SADFL11_2203 [Roseibium alexandrii DFL-11]
MRPIAFFLSSLFIFLMTYSVKAADCNIDKLWRVSFGLTPGITEPGKKSPMVNFVSELADDIGVKLTYEITPFRRSIISVSVGRADMHLPMLQADDRAFIDENLMYSEATFFEVPFYVYTSSERNSLDSDYEDELKTIETEAKHAHFFPFPVIESDCIECSLRKLMLGRIDAFIYAEQTTEKTIKKLGLEARIRREFYRAFPAKAVIRRNECGEKLDQILSKLVPSKRSNAIHPAFRPKANSSVESN